MNMAPRFLTFLRWTARIIGGLVVLLVAAIAIGEGVPNPFQQTADVNACSLALVAMLMGQMIAWKWEGIGGVLILAGFAGFAIANRGIELNAVFAPMLFTGLAFAFCGWFSWEKS